MGAHCFQHASFEGPGSLGDVLGSLPGGLTVTALHQGERLPRPAQVDFLLVLGGPMSVNDGDAFPWLAAEKEFLGSYIRTGKPLLGLCLGAQLIASALGARVYPNPLKEIGWFPVQAVGAPGPGLLPLEEEQMVFHWHGETFDLPPGALRLARSPGCHNQAFQFGPAAVGLQFHPEAVGPSVEALLEACGHELVPGPYIQTEQTIRTLTAVHHAQANRFAAQTVDFLLGSGR